MTLDQQRSVSNASILSFPLLIQENEASQLICLWGKKENAIHIFKGYVSNQLLNFKSDTYNQIVHIYCFV